MIKEGMLHLTAAMWVRQNEEKLKQAEVRARGDRRCARDNRDLVAFMGGFKRCEEGVLQWLKEVKAPPALVKQFAEKRRD